MASSSERTGTTVPAATVDHRKGPRRRGETLRQAIFTATLDELAERGYARLTMDSIAERARTSKASLYRRWTTRAELVVAAIADVRPGFDPPPDTGTLRGDLLALLSAAATQLAGPAGQVVRGLLADALHHPELLRVLRERILDTRREVVREILRRAVERGEARSEALTDRIVDLGPTLLTNHFLLYDTPITDQTIIEIVDVVLMPLAVSSTNPPVSKFS